MHLFQGEKDTNFHYNSDLSGDVIIISGGEEITIAGSDILGLIAEFIREQEIEKIEQMTVNELIGINERR